MGVQAFGNPGPRASRMCDSPCRSSRRVWFYQRAPLIVTLFFGFFCGGILSEVAQGYLPVSCDRGQNMNVSDNELAFHYSVETIRHPRHLCEPGHARPVVPHSLSPSTPAGQPRRLYARILPRQPPDSPRPQALRNQPALPAHQPFPARCVPAAARFPLRRRRRRKRILGRRAS